MKSFEQELLPKSNFFKKKSVIISIIVLLILIMSCIVGFITLNKNSAGSSIFLSFDSELSDGIVPGMTEEQVKKLLQQQADASMLGFQINASPVFEDGQSKGNLLIGNPPSNTYNLKVKLTLDSSGEILYESGLIPPNSHISEVALSKNLPKGNYQATATIFAYQDNPIVYLGETGVKIDINIKN